jgi:outer membrane protein assembly factor BamE (lipoprotein component of BamABCDE complex)
MVLDIILHYWMMDIASSIWRGNMKRALIALYLLALTGCAASGKQVKEEQISGFKEGQTTINEVVAALGQPNHNMMLGDGSRVITYAYARVTTRPETFIPFAGAFVGGADMQTNSVTLSFDKNGVLKTKSASSGQSGTGMGVMSGVSQQPVADEPKQAP